MLPGALRIAAAPQCLVSASGGAAVATGRAVGQSMMALWQECGIRVAKDQRVAIPLRLGCPLASPVYGFVRSRPSFPRAPPRSAFARGLCRAPRETSTSRCGIGASGVK